jgi:hypothetical protein
MRQSNFALRLQESLLKEARLLSRSEGVALNQFINVAVAEKVSALKTVEYLRERAARANIPEAREILKKAGRGHNPDPADRLEPENPHAGMPRPAHPR